MPALAAALWLLGLLVAAPALRSGQRYAFLDRLRDALLLGCAIPLALALLHLLYPATCWLALAAALAIAARRGLRLERTDAPLPYATIAVVALVAWPALVRPLLDGDSLAYHLPIAAAWVHQGSLWTAATRYWWYPSTSESFAAGIYAVAGPFALGWSGVGVLLLLGWRIATSARERFGLPPRLADALGAATIAAVPLALQAGSLQNDVWLAALWLEALFDASPVSSALAGGLCALVKPYGWLFALVAALLRRERGMWIAFASCVGVWLARDAILWHGAFAAVASTHYGGASPTSSILAHGAGGFATLARAFARYAPFAFLAWLAALAAPWLRVERRLGACACAAGLFFLIVPFGYDNGLPQLANGASLRFAIPAVALGALALGPALRRYADVATPLLWLFAAQGVASVLGIFWNDAPTRSAFAVAALALAAVWAGRRWSFGLPVAGFALAVVVAVRLAGSHPADYYRDVARARGESTGIYAWLARTSPPVVAAWGMRVGILNIVAPHIHTLDLSDANVCAQARRAGGILVALAQPGPPSRNAIRLRIARGCGRVVYDDRLAVAVSLSY